MSLFNISRFDGVVGKNGLYRGHLYLATVKNAKLRRYLHIFKKHFDNLLLKEKEVKIIKETFFDGFLLEYFLAQKTLAQKFLGGKIVQVKRGIPHGNAKPKEMYVYYVGFASSYELEKNPDVLFELAYGEDSLGKILVTKNTQIKILGKIPKD
ncbi:MAG TPA: hypothetical protein ENJ27_01430 [Candidatus Moranbacteria bacterium]|nr:hypothetical protein [Candidatus Moranbacteria bacterium]